MIQFQTPRCFLGEAILLPSCTIIMPVVRSTTLLQFKYHGHHAPYNLFLFSMLTSSIAHHNSML